jgi:hypothetical protein
VQLFARRETDNSPANEGDSLSVSVGSAMEAANVAATFAAVQQKLNPTHFND